MKLQCMLDEGYERHDLKLSIACLFVMLALHGAFAQDQEMRPITVIDSIGMAVLDVRDADDPVTLSPDGEKFLLVMHRGNLKNNTNDYSLLLFRCANASHPTSPQLLLLLSSSSNK